MVPADDEHLVAGHESVPDSTNLIGGSITYREAIVAPPRCLPYPPPSVCTPLPSHFSGQMGSKGSISDRFASGFHTEFEASSPSLLLCAAAPEEFISKLAIENILSFSSTPPANTEAVMALLANPSSRKPLAK